MASTKAKRKKAEAAAEPVLTALANPAALPQKFRALDAAAKVLEEAKAPMSCGEMIEAMSAKGYWSSPNGLTPAATLSSAILRDLKTNGDASRFAKTGRGKFARA